ncbi:MAG: Mu transposase C-terminal domain-containing protein [Planctomycetes bacterium]|nr:Mu transposase C-terminal domain-containing protein [Planctomycetota bacterium]
METIFLWREHLSVSKVHTFSLCGNEFEVTPELASDVIEVRYIPFDLWRVFVYRGGVFLLRARLVTLPQPIHPKGSRQHKQYKL